MTEYVELEVEIVTSTDKAVLVRTEDGEEKWIPWSQIEDNGEDFKEKGLIVTMYVSEWFCKNEGLI